MPVDEYFTELYRGMDAAGGDDEGAQERRDAFHREYQGDPAAWDATGVAVEDTAIDGPHGPIPVRVYRPEGDVAGAVLWAHGGGFLAGDIDMFEGHVVSIELARRARAAVASVDYRLAVDGVRYPVPIDDVHAAWDWWRGETPADLPVAIGGASAGAALAMAAAMRSRDAGTRAPDALLLAYPFAHYPNPALTVEQEAAMSAVPFRFSPEGVEGMVRNYTGRISDVPADALPGGARLDGLPPARIVASEYDDLRASAELLERQLREVGVPVELFVAEGMPHGHLNHTPRIGGVAASLDFLAKGV